MPLSQVFTREELEKMNEKITSGEVPINSRESKLLIAKTHENDYLSFAKAFLAEHFKEPSPPFHRQMGDYVVDFLRVAIAAPRGHAKSTNISFAFPLHAALYGKKKNIVIISSSEDMAVRFLRRIRDELETNRRLLWLFGPMRTDKWSETELRLSNGTVFHAKGRGAQLRGLIDGANRPDLIILDDIEDEELVRSELRRADLEQWLNGTVIPTLEPKTGQVVIIGTILHEDSLLARVLNKELYPEFKSLRYAAMDPEKETSLWPERFAYEDLVRIKNSYLQRTQLAQFYMEYMNNPIPQEAADFKPEMIQFFDELPKNDPQFFVEVYIDLGGGSVKQTADYTAILILAVDKANNIYVHDYINKKYGTDTASFVRDVVSIHVKYRPLRFVVEKTQAANFVKASLDAEMKKQGIFFEVEYVTPPRGSGDRRGNMSDAKYQRIAALASPMKFGVIKIRRWMTEMIEQLLAFPRATHDDLTDALGYGYMLINRRLVREGRSPGSVMYDPNSPYEQKQSTDAYDLLYPELGV